MSKITLINLEQRAVTLACSSFALLLGACGGGGDAAGAPAQAQTAAGATVPQQARPPDPAPAGQAVPAAADEADDAGGPDAAQLPDVAPESFAVAGYGTGGAGDEQASVAARPGSALYVSPQGADDNPGSATRPFRTLARAARAVAPGTTVYVAPGLYSGGVKTTASGRADARIAFVSTRRWGARIVPPARSGSASAWDNRGDYVDIVGFDIDGGAHRGGERWTSGIYNGGSHDTIRSNHVHHVAREGGCNSAGGAAIGVDGYYGGVQSHALANLVHDIGPAGCRFVQGIYMSTTGSVKNNVVYRVAEAGIHLWHDAREVIVSNNTVTGSNTGIVVGGGDFYRTSGPNDRTAVYNNIVYDNKIGISELGSTGRNNSYRNNLVYKNSSYDWRLKNGLTHSGTVSSAPLFAGNTSAALPDLSLSASSPAIGRATPQHAAATDFNGRPRNVFSGYDIGAYQH
ncbi:right-handed parallel beta-helix repeat-containing protein [Massilia genomosp. 1]|uniref:DUF1565 domain-containing protein n=1 Tax=Massilia genomosp. 1 TaxID=2609280 RepID=A0ABX0MMW9_9BURK|nr:right-handed parallel beta-helix repeat-containing protein [Massilia genomosp. 1]NHZ61368.1 DUF1565 domain-containing protein [Massilia genomosp. 1]